MFTIMFTKKSREVINEDYGRLKLDIDLETMSTAERSHAVTVLQRAVGRLSEERKRRLLNKLVLAAHWLRSLGPTTPLVGTN